MQYYNTPGMGRMAYAPVTKNLLIINIIVFIPNLKCFIKAF